MLINAKTPLSKGSITIPDNDIINVIAKALIRAEYDTEFRKTEFARITGREDGVSIVDDDSALIPGPSGRDAAITATAKIVISRNRVKGWKRKAVGIQNEDAALNLLCGYSAASTRWIVPPGESIQIPLPDDVVLYCKGSAAGPMAANWWEFGNGLPDGVKSS